MVKEYLVDAPPLNVAIWPELSQLLVTTLQIQEKVLN